MKPGNRLPDDQAEIVFSDVFVEQLEACSGVERLEIMTTVVALCSDPGGCQHTWSSGLNHGPDQKWCVGDFPGDAWPVLASDDREANLAAVTAAADQYRR